MKKVNNATIGTDPEFFLFSINKNEIVSAEGLIGGTKEEPRKISNVGHAVQEDNIMVEFNIPPAIDEQSFSRDIEFVMEHIMSELSEDYQISTKAASEINQEYLQTEQAQRFGCEPDYNVWEEMVNDAPHPDVTTRCAGGHLHVGYDEPSIETSVELVKAMDLFLGVPSVLIDSDTLRKSMYGKAGSFRIKSYGIEYRSLSNFFIFSDDLRRWAFRNTLKAINFVNSGKTINEELGERIINIINNNNKKEALKLTKEFNIEYIKPVITEIYETRR